MRYEGPGPDSCHGSKFETIGAWISLVLVVILFTSLILVGCVTPPKKSVIPQNNIDNGGLNIIFINDTNEALGMQLNWINHPWRDVAGKNYPWTMADDPKIDPLTSTWSSITSPELDELSHWELIWYDFGLGGERFFKRYIITASPGKYVIKASPYGFECDGCKIEKHDEYTFIFIPDKFFK